MSKNSDWTGKRKYFDEYPGKSKSDVLNDVYESYAFVVIHELIHNAAKNGTYTDPQVLQAAIDILKEDGLDAPEYTDDVNRTSQRINTGYLQKYCPTILSNRNSTQLLGE